MSWFSKVVTWFEHLGHSNWEQSASTTLKLVAPLTETIVTEAAGEADADKVQSLVTEVQSDLAVAATLISGADAPGASAGTQITTALNSVTANLGGLLSAGHIKNPATLTKVTSIVKTVVGEVEAILSAMPKKAA